MSDLLPDKGVTNRDRARGRNLRLAGFAAPIVLTTFPLILFFPAHDRFERFADFCGFFVHYRADLGRFWVRGRPWIFGLLFSPP